MKAKPNAQRDVLSIYVRALANMLALKDWTFYLNAAPAADGRAAEIVPVPGRRHATLRLAATWPQLSPPQQRAAIVHELLECHHAPARQLALVAVPADMQPLYELEIERAIDSIADAIAPMMPLPFGSTLDAQ